VRGREVASPVVRIAIVEGADAPWRGEAVPDPYGLVMDGREYWVGTTSTAW